MNCIWGMVCVFLSVEKQLAVNMYIYTRIHAYVYIYTHIYFQLIENGF